VNYAPLESGSSTCFGGVQSNTGIGFSIFGDIFIKSQFIVFNQGSTPQLGAAPKASS
jgi:aspergillopepsin I